MMVFDILHSRKSKQISINYKWIVKCSIKNKYTSSEFSNQFKSVVLVFISSIFNAGFHGVLN